MGILACAENIIVTGDTVSMCSEACGTGKPVIIFEGKNWLTKKHLRFVNSLYNKGYAISINDANALSFSPKQKLENTKEIADKILEIR